MAAPAEINGSAAVKATNRASEEQGEPFLKLAEASTEKSTASSVNKIVSNENSCNRSTTSNVAFTSVKVTVPENMKASSIETPAKNAKITDITQGMDEAVNKLECQSDGQVSKYEHTACSQNLKLPHDGNPHHKQELLSVPVTGNQNLKKQEPLNVKVEAFAGKSQLKQEPQGSQNLKHKLQDGNQKQVPMAEKGNLKLKPQAKNQNLKQESKSHTHKQDLKAGNQNLKMDLQTGKTVNQEHQAGHQKVKNHPSGNQNFKHIFQAINNTLKHIPQAINNSLKADSKTDKNNPKAEKVVNVAKVSSLPVEKTKAILRSEAKSVPRLLNETKAEPSLPNEPRTESVLPNKAKPKIPSRIEVKVESTVSNESKAKLLSSVKSAVEPLPSKAGLPFSTEVKVAEQNKGNIMFKPEAESSLGDSVIEIKGQVNQLTEIHSAPVELETEINYSFDVSSMQTRAEIKPALDKLEQTPEAGRGDGVIENENRTKDDKDLEISVDISQFPSAISCGDRVTEDTIPQDSRLPETKVPHKAKSELAADSTGRDRVSEDKKKSLDSKALQKAKSEITSDAACGIRASEDKKKTLDNNKMLETKIPSKTKSEFSSDIACGDHITDDKKMISDSSEIMSDDKKVTLDGAEIISDDIDKAELAAFNGQSCICGIKSVGQSAESSDSKLQKQNSEVTSEIVSQDSLSKTKCETPDNELSEFTSIQDVKTEDKFEKGGDGIGVKIYYDAEYYEQCYALPDDNKLDVKSVKHVEQDVEIVSDFSVTENRTPDSKLSEVKLSQEQSELVCDIIVNENIPEINEQDNTLHEVKLSQEKSEFVSDIGVNVTQVKTQDYRLSEVKLGNEFVDLVSGISVNEHVTESNTQHCRLSQVKLTHEISQLVSNVIVCESDTQDPILSEVNYGDENYQLVSDASEVQDCALPEMKIVEEKCDQMMENSLIESLSEHERYSEALLFEEISLSMMSYAGDTTENDVKTISTSEIKSAQECFNQKWESFDESIFENVQTQQSDWLPDFSYSQDQQGFTEFDVNQPVTEYMNDNWEQGSSDDRPFCEMLVGRQYSEDTGISSDRPVLETLTFNVNKLTQNVEESAAESATEVCVCPLCDRSYPADNKDVLAHLVLMHKFVIADVNYIAILPAYLKYWKARFEEKPISEFCSKIVTNTGAYDQAPKEEFYLLCDALPEDKSIREHLQRKKLESVLAQQQKEREETKFCRQCLFCRQTFCGNRAVLFDHLLKDHTFHVGRPDNLVYTDELLDLIQSKLENQLCLFCERSFKDKASLREHMRKKQHRKINPKNKEYDRFYIVNYMEMGKNWESLQSEDNRLIKSGEKDTDEEEEWSGWNDESESKVVCLFCDSSCEVQADLQQHMKERHSFDLQEVNNKLQLNFYQKVKLINYIRRQVYHRTCYGCQESFENKDKLQTHFDEFSDHVKKIPDAEEWDQPQYFFPTYEDDCLLCQLDDDDEGAAGDALGVIVIAETISVPETILSDQKLCYDLLTP